MRAEEVRAIIAASPLAGQVDRIMAQVRPAVRLRSYLAEDDDLPLGTSRLGGPPDLPPGFVWPEQQGRPLDFLTQIDLSAASKVHPLPLLPTTGWLVIFHELAGPISSDPAEFIVHFDADPSSLVRQEPPEALEHRLNFCELLLEREDCVPNLFNFVDDWRPGSGQVENVAWDACEKLNEKINDSEGMTPVHRIGGYPMLIQGPDEESSPDWPFLLQISSDYELGWMWGDWGRLYFWTQPRGAHQLGPVCSVMECY